VNCEGASQPNDSARIFVGLDVHKKNSEVAIVNEDGIVKEQERRENKIARCPKSVAAA
jgi:hypothetical protein